MHWVGLMVDLSNPPLRQNSICEVGTTLSDGSLEVKLTGYLQYYLIFIFLLLFFHSSIRAWWPESKIFGTL